MTASNELNGEAERKEGRDQQTNTLTWKDGTKKARERNKQVKLCFKNRKRKNL